MNQSRGRRRCAMSASTNGHGAGSPNSGRSGYRELGASATEALARFITIAVEHGAKTPEGLRVYLYSALSPDSECGREAHHEKWMAKNCLPLGELDRERIADIDRRLGLKLDGSPMAANTPNRIRIIARASVQSAIEAGAIAPDAWPQRSKTRAGRKVARTRRSVDVRSVPRPSAMAEAIDAIVTQQPGSKTYRVMTAVAYYAGLRPSEVVMLRVRSAELPAEGGGRLDVTEADISFDEPGEPEDRAAQRADPAGTRRGAARVGRTEQPHVSRSVAVPNAQQPPSQRFELGTCVASRA